MPGGLTTPTRASQVQRCLDSATTTTTTTTTAYAAPTGAVETASPSVQTTRTQMGGDGGSLEEKVEQAAPPRITPVHVQGDAPNHPTEQQWQDPALLCVIGRDSYYIRGTGGPPVRWFVITALQFLRIKLTSYCTI